MMMNKIRNFLDTKTKKIIAIICSVLFIVISSVSIYALTRPEKELLYSVKEIRVEYGENVPSDVKEYLHFNELSEKEEEEVLTNVVISFDDLPMEEDKGYPNIGEYTATLTYKEEVVETKVIVEDTIAPVFNTINEIEIIQGMSDFEYGEYILAEDIQEITYDFKLDDFDSNEVGEHTMEVLATDASSNVTSKEIKITVIEEPDQEYDIEIIVDEEAGKVSMNVVLKPIEEPVIEPEEVEVEPTPVDNNNIQPEIIELNVPYINQYQSGAPMGCEGASLLQAVQSKGFGTWDNLKAMLDNMPYTDTGNPHHGYVSSPYVIEGDDVYQSIFPSALAPYGTNRYGVNCVNTSGFTPQQLVDELRKGNPSVVYVTYNFQMPIWDNYVFGRCVKNMHVMTLIGYNAGNGQYKVMDPVKGAYWVDGPTFEHRYNLLQMAITVR